MKTVSDSTIYADPAQLSLCLLTDENNRSIPMQSLWEKQTAIFIFLRHFACEACRTHALQVWNHRASYVEKGAKLHFIGNGSVHFMKAFKESYQLQDASFFTDPTLRSFQAAGFRRGFWINPGEYLSRPKFLGLAIRQAILDPNQGDVWQLGGILVVHPGGKISYQFTSQAIGHFPPSADINPPRSVGT
jgi:hypothetical protein